jgi:glucan endo-1,3-alpha-glucosidase
MSRVRRVLTFAASLFAWVAFNVSAAPTTDVAISKRGGDQTGQQKYVFAHMMVANTDVYTVNDWIDDIKLASAAGIDAFALNIGPESFYKDQVKNAYKAAEQSGTNFKMLMSFDMT